RLELVVFQAEPNSWRQYTGEHGRILTIKPDAFAIIANQEWENRWFIEVDRATEHRPTIIRKANDYIRYWHAGTEQRTHDVFPRVMWIAPDDNRADQLTDWLSNIDQSATDIFDVCTDATFTTAISAALAT